MSEVQHCRRSDCSSCGLGIALYSGRARGGEESKKCSIYGYDENYTCGGISESDWGWTTVWRWRKSCGDHFVWRMLDLYKVRLYEVTRMVLCDYGTDGVFRGVMMSSLEWYV